jgi:hypothetical protein
VWHGSRKSTGILVTTSLQARSSETIISVEGEKRLGPMRWGFVSPTAKEPKLAPIGPRRLPPHGIAAVLFARVWSRAAAAGDRER